MMLSTATAAVAMEVRRTKFLVARNIKVVTTVSTMVLAMMSSTASVKSSELASLDDFSKKF